MLDAMISNWVNLSQTSWTVPLFDAGDVSDDVLLTISKGLLASAGWVEGDRLSFENQGNGTLQLKITGHQDAELVKITKKCVDDGEESVDVNLDDL
ncbi:hypothetical protein [Chromobacterium sp. ASV23]|uniref:hypothetical protein n=1 Tax=Chromobacterium sp. ASV23 TaxID=2795110 RepID=UPI0018EB85BA|nr:hypothetical protein [Chromobacterium sp. ASV23]